MSNGEKQEWAIILARVAAVASLLSEMDARTINIKSKIVAAAAVAI